MFISGFLMTRNEQMTFFRAMENLQLRRFGRFLALRGLQGPLKVSNGFQWTAQCAMRSQDKIFYYGMISLWGKLGVTHVKGEKWNK